LTSHEPRLVDTVGADFWGKGKGRKRGDEYGADGRVSGGVVWGEVLVWGWRGVLGKGSFGRE
jgi:hypothetical protein